MKLITHIQDVRIWDIDMRVHLFSCLIGVVLGGGLAWSLHPSATPSSKTFDAEQLPFESSSFSVSHQEKKYFKSQPPTKKLAVEKYAPPREEIIAPQANFYRLIKELPDYQIDLALKSLLKMNMDDMPDVTNKKEFAARIMDEVIKDLAGTGSQDTPINQEGEISFLSSFEKGDDFYKDSFEKNETKSIFATFNSSETQVVVKCSNVSTGEVLLLKHYPVSKETNSINYVKMNIPKGWTAGKYSFNVYKADSSLALLASNYFVVY
jgi:hypothetical protein